MAEELQYLEEFDERLQVNLPFKCDIVNDYRIVVRILFQLKGEELCLNIT